MILVSAAPARVEEAGPDVALLAAGSVLLLAGVLLVGMHLSVRAVRWYLDPASRAAVRPPGERPPRQDF